VGFLVAAMYSQGAFNKYAGLWTLHRMARLTGEAGMSAPPSGSGDCASDNQ